MTGGEDLIWRKASASTAQGADCVEVAVLDDGGRAVRDSKRSSVVLRAGGMGWRAFLIGIQEGNLA